MESLKLLQTFILLRSLTPNTYLVGGCVRDMLLGKKPKDFDIVTDAHMDDIERIFLENGWKVDSVGKNFLIIFVAKDDEQFEIANFRKEEGFSDGRRPDTVQIGDMTTDAQRRDFTINAIYHDPISGSFFDPNNGKKDLDSKVLKFIGKPQERIREDYLRVFRFYRFLLSTGFTPDKKSLVACRQHFTEAYDKTTAERVRMELEKMVGL